MGRRGGGDIALDAGIAFDAGALVAIERRAKLVGGLIRQAGQVHLPAGALAQVWRDPRRQVLLGRFIASDAVTIHPLDADAAKAAGILCGARGTADIVDASVVQVAQIVGCPVITSDPDDLRHLAPGWPIFAI